MWVLRNILKNKSSMCMNELKIVLKLFPDYNLTIKSRNYSKKWWSNACNCKLPKRDFVPALVLIEFPCVFWNATTNSTEQSGFIGGEIFGSGHDMTVQIFSNAMVVSTHEVQRTPLKIPLRSALCCSGHWSWVVGALVTSHG